MTAPRLIVRDVRLYERPVEFRMPFRFGASALGGAPLAFARVRVEVEGAGEGWGMSAEMMMPKWFDKSPGLTEARNVEQLRLSLHLAADLYGGLERDTAFGLHEAAHDDHLAAAGEAGLNPLVAGYGPALLDRAVLDALCRIYHVSFWDGMRANLPGMKPSHLYPDLEDADFGGFMSCFQPSETLHVRHTVGLDDPLTAADKKAGHRIGDGLPETLEEVIAAYGCNHFKVKVGGDGRADLDRLSSIAAVLGDRVERYRITLDGNERFADFDAVRAFWNDMRSAPDLSRFVGSVLYFEQPLPRAMALERDVPAAAALPPLVIDESDDTPDAFPRARARGYAGVSVKGCKGLYRGVANAARCQRWNSGERNGRHILSAEDLTSPAGLALQQNLAIASLLGVGHAERNGHHYVRGMSGASAQERDAFLAAHEDLYESREGAVCLRIQGGRVSLGSLSTVGFACGVEPDWGSMAAMARPVD